MDSFGIKHESCPILQSVKAGVSAVICSLETGSRTIIHCNGALPELSYDQFKQNINLNNYSWIHFEVRVFKQKEFVNFLASILFCRVEMRTESLRC